MGAEIRLKNVARNNMSNKDLFQKVKGLKLPIGKYALFGSAPICVRGLRECRDIDIIVTKELWGEYKNRPEWKAKKTNKGSEYLCNGQIELWKNWRPKVQNIEKLINEAEVINGLPFVKIEEVVKRKKLRGEKKDLKDVKIIEEFLRS